MRLIGLLATLLVLAIALWLVFHAPNLGGGSSAPVSVAPPVARPAVDALTQNALAEAAAEKARAAAKAKATRAAALAAERAAEAAQADAIEQNMTPAENRLYEDYAAQVGDTRPAPAASGNLSTSPDGNSL